MNAGGDERELAMQWRAKADADLKSAHHLAAYGAEADPGSICFHAQQAVEKCLRALLVLRGDPVPRTHDLGAVAEALPSEVRDIVDRDALDALADYAVTTRYPGPFEEPTFDDAMSAIAIAEQVVAIVCPHLALTDGTFGG